MLTQEEIERLDKLLEQLKEWTEEVDELLTDEQKERIDNAEQQSQIGRKLDMERHS